MTCFAILRVSACQTDRVTDLLEATARVSDTGRSRAQPSVQSGTLRGTAHPAVAEQCLDCYKDAIGRGRGQAAKRFGGQGPHEQAIWAKSPGCHQHIQSTGKQSREVQGVNDISNNVPVSELAGCEPG